MENTLHLSTVLDKVGGVPLNYIGDRDIEDAIKHEYVLENVEDVYDLFERTDMTMESYDLLMLSTLVKNIKNECYIPDYSLIVWDDDNGNLDYKLSYLDMYYVRAYYHCQFDGLPVLRRRNN